MREDWVEISFNEILEKLETGKRPKGGVLKYSNGVPSIGGEHLNSSGGFVFDNIKFVPEKFAKQMTKGVIENQDILIVKDGATTGKVSFVDHNFSFEFAVLNEHVFKCKLYTGLYPKFIFYFLFSSAGQRRILKNFKGSAQGGINTSFAPNTKIPFPPLPIQRAIVTKIENLVASLDKGIGDLKKAQEQLKVYRQAVLKKAFEGDYDKTTIGNLFDFVGGGTPSKKEKRHWNGNIPWASVKDIKGDFLTKTQDCISEEGLKNSSSNLALENEVVLITRISPGKAIITKLDTAINQDLKIVRPKKEINIRFTFFLFKSIERDCIKLSSGTTVLGINLQNLKSITIPIVELEEQHQIVQEIDSRLSVCEKVEQSITEGLEKSEALRQSILKQAFEGKLLSEAEIEQCKQEADYEPASVLLKKIKK